MIPKNESGCAFAQQQGLEITTSVCFILYPLFVSNMSFAKRIVSTGRLAAEKAFVQSRGFKSTTHLQTRVTLNSWSADRLKELGEKIEEGEVLPHTHLTKELLYNPSPKVLRIGNELLACNMIESVQFMSVIQVCLESFLLCIFYFNPVYNFLFNL